MNKSIKWYTKPGKKDAKASLLFSGDFAPIRRYEQNILSGGKVFDDYIENKIEESDLFVVNLEAPLCDKELDANIPGFTSLRTDGKIAEWMKNTGIDVAGIANNHLRDFNDEGVVQTIENLDRVKIICAGGGKTISEAEKMQIVEVNGLKVGLWMLAEKELNVATEKRAGTSFFNPDADVYIIPQLRKQVDFLVVVVHAGHEFSVVPSPRIRKSYRSFIEAGADLVIGHHPHVTQGIEQYKNGWIAYSLGNFVFDLDYMSRIENTRQGYLFSVGVSSHSVEDIKVIPYNIIRDNAAVETCSEKELADYENMLKELSSYISDDVKFENCWERFVIDSWDIKTKNYHRDFIKNYMDENNSTFIWMLKNCHGCPTAHELLEKTMDLLLKGKISR
jgi:poly-gamma-glutamate synthesis protein (capsule biosynthesis protein)